MITIFDFMIFKIFSCLCFSISVIFINLQPGKILSQTNWQWQHPLPTGNTFYSIDFVDGKTGFAAGSMGNIIKTNDEGISWVNLNSGTTENIFKIKFLNANTGFCAGKNGLILRTSNSGITWTQIYSTSDYDIHDISIAGNIIFACGLGGKVLMSSDHGNTWVNINTKINIPLFCIDFLNETTGISGGYNGIIRTTNGGINWEILNAGITPSSQIVGIKFANENKIYAVGNSPFGDFYFSNNGGDSWQKNSLGMPYLFGGSVDLIRGMDFIDSVRGNIVTDLGTILSTTNGGKQWQTDTSQRYISLKESILKDIHFLDSDNLFLCGNGGRVLKYSGNKNNWNTLTGNNMNFHDNYITNDGTIFCTGDRGILFRKRPGDNDWQKIFIKNGHKLKSIFFVNDLTGHVCSDGKIFKTTDGGDTWNEVSIRFRFPNKYKLNKIFFINKYNGYITGGNEEVNEGIILISTDGGNSWKTFFKQAGAGVFRDIYFTTINNGFVVGDNGNIFKTTDAGINWSLEKLIPYDLNSIDFYNSSNGIITGDNGTIFKSSDGGLSWNYISQVQYNDLNSAEYINLNNIIAVGNNGTVINSTNSGFNWKNVISVTENNLMSVNFYSNSIYALGENGTILYSIYDSEKKSISAGKSNIDIEPVSSFVLTNYPNPFNPKTIINYELSVSGFVKVTVHDILGKEVITLVDEMKNPGVNKIEFDASRLSNGMYFYDLTFNGKLIDVKRMVLLK